MSPARNCGYGSFRWKLSGRLFAGLGLGAGAIDLLSPKAMDVAVFIYGNRLVLAGAEACLRSIIRAQVFHLSSVLRFQIDLNSARKYDNGRMNVSEGC